MKRHLMTWILGLCTVSMIFGVVLIFMLSTFATGAEKRDVEFSTGPFIAQLPDEIPPFVREILEEEGIDPQKLLEELKNLKDSPELRREIREKVMDNPDIREEFQKRADDMRERWEAPQGKSEGKQRGPKDDKRQGKGGVAVDKYYKSIVDNNLFRPLGWGGEDKGGPPFRLIGTVINKGKKPKALIFEFATNTTHYVAVGDKIGNATVKAIDEKSVTINKDGEELLKLNIMQESPFLGGSTGGKGGGGPRVGSSPPPLKNVGSSRSRSKRPTGKLREKFKKMSPEEREKFIRKMRENQRIDGGGDFRRERIRRR